MSALAGLLGKIGPKLSGLVSGAQYGREGHKGLAKLLQAAANRENDAGPSQHGQSFGHLADIVKNVGAAGDMLKKSTSKVDFGGALTADSPTKALAGGLRSIGNAGGAIGTGIGAAVGGPAGAAIGGIVGEAAGALPKFVASIVESVDKLREWSKELHSANMQFADFSASMARVQAETEVQEFYIKRQQGENRAGSAQYQARGMLQLEQTMAPLEDLWANIQNYMAGFGSRLANDLLTGFTVGGLNLSQWSQFMNWLMGGSTAEGVDAAEFTYELGKAAQESRDRRPPEMR